MLATVQGLSCEDLAALKGERRKIAESLTKLLASKLTHEFKVMNMGPGDKVPPSISEWRKYLVSSFHSKLTGLSTKKQLAKLKPDKLSREEFQSWRKAREVQRPPPSAPPV